jgi:hypothetical protein
MHHLTRQNGPGKEISGLIDQRELLANARDELLGLGEVGFSGRHEKRMKDEG